MSYSRWSSDSWYCFWSTESNDTTKDGQILALWYSMDPKDLKNWTYTELLTVTESTIKESYNCTEAEAKRAMGYIKEFMTDVHNEFPPTLEETNNNIILSETE